MFHSIEKRIFIIPVPRFLIIMLECIGAHKTPIRKGEQVLAHMHKYLALYFTSNIRWIQCKGGKKKLPRYAMAIVFPRAVHGWVDTISEKDGVVSHFHHGHPAHHIDQVNK